MSLWNFTIPDTSPILSYHPYADGFGLQNGWQTWYTTSGFNTQLGESGQGDSYHLTRLADAQVTLQFYGSAIYLYGTANASYEVTLDNAVESFSSANGLMYSKEGLIEENHSVTLTSKSGDATELLGFGHAVVSSSDQQLPVETFYDNSNSALSYTGRWTSMTVKGIPNSTVTAPFHRALGVGSSVTMNFSSAVAIALYGSNNFGHLLYSVSIDNEPPQISNASTFWLVADTPIFFRSGLDPGRMHTLNATNISGGGENFTLSSVVVYQADPSQSTPSSTSSSSAGGSNTTTGTSAHSHSKVGEIVGPVVGALVLVLGLIAGFLWLRSRKSRRDLSATISPLILFHQNPSSMTQTGNGNIPSKMTQHGLRPPVARKNQPAPVHTVIAPHSSPPSSTRRLVSPTSPPSPAGPASPATADVNQIIELIAQRIDRRREDNSENQLPPGYRVHSM
ncbi:hypothetical protein FB451DRAFT_1125416 [Mycena latifolia]|nr:hypothetical protein FB451DRAFT_1125416 [Mycena latifolia]